MAWVIFKKEIREMLRDRRVTIGAFVMPMLMVILMFKLIGTISTSVESNRASKIGVLNGTENSMVKILKQIPGSQIISVSNKAKGLKMLDDGDLRLLIDPGKDFDGDLQRMEGSVNAYYLSGEPMSQVALKTVSATIEGLNKKAAAGVLEAKGLPAKTLEPIAVKEHDQTKESAKDSIGLVSLLPYMIVLWAFYGGFSSVSDMMAGEKERGTLETLLIAPIQRKEVANGKLIALSLICWLSSIAAALGIVIAYVTSGKMAGFRVEPANLILLILAVLPLVFMFAGLLLSVSTWAKNPREAQTYLSVISFVVLIPAVMSNMIGFTDLGNQTWVKLTPVLGTSIGLRSILLGKIDWTAILGSAGVCMILALVFVVVTRRLLEQEKVLVRI
ncbi:MAG: ABC transporter permease [Armatimonadetes bacterium]|nr:ABC transporter permease [Armatimonadota bacterium]